MAAGNTPAPSSPPRAQRDNNKPHRVLKLRFAVRRHAEGPVGERRVDVGGEEVAARLPRLGGSPRPTRRGEGGGAGRGGGGDGGEMSAWSSACPGGGCAAAAVAEGGSAAVHTCHACFKSFDRVKALYGHMRSCRGAAAAEEPLVLPQQEREKKPRAEKKENLLLLAKGLARTWAVTGTRGRAGGRSRSPGHSANELYQAKTARVAAPERARVAEILREVTGLQIREEDLDRPWVSEMVRGAQGLMFLTAAGDAVSNSVPLTAAVDGHSEKDVAAADVPVPLAKIPEVKIPEHSSTVCSNSPAVPEIEVIVIDDDDDDNETNDAVAEIDNTSSVTVATAQAAATVVLALPAPEAAVAVAIAPAPAATAAAAAAAAVTIAVAAPGAAYVNGNGNGIVAATGTGGAGAGQIKMFPCPRCHKVFDCFRALGGHMASHKNSERRARELQDIWDVSAALEVTLSGGACRARANAWANGRGYHVCVKCRRMFPTGQSLGGHMRLHYAGPPLIGNPGSGPGPWPVPPHAGGFLLHGPAATAVNTAAFVHGPAATGIGAYPYPPATTNLFPLRFAVPKKEEEGKPPGVMAMAPPGNGGRGRLRLFGVDIVEGPKQEPME